MIKIIQSANIGPKCIMQHVTRRETKSSSFRVNAKLVEMAVLASQDLSTAKKGYSQWA